MSQSGEDRRLEAAADPPPGYRWSTTAPDLMAATYPEPRWAVPGIVPEGLSLLAGAPKVGKSWLALTVGTAVASGGHALGSIPVEQGDVLYLALEDTARRLQRRLRIVLGDDQPAPERLHLVTAWPGSAEGYPMIAEWLDEHPDARMVIVDVLAKVRDDRNPDWVYASDYGCMQPLKMLADRYGVAIVVLHHVRKAGSQDFLDTVSGTHGLAGAADAVLVLSRTRNAAAGKLAITGRDVEEAEHALAFDACGCRKLGRGWSCCVSVLVDESVASN